MFATRGAAREDGALTADLLALSSIPGAGRDEDSGVAGAVPADATPARVVAEEGTNGKEAGSSREDERDVASHDGRVAENVKDLGGTSEFGLNIGHKAFVLNLADAVRNASALSRMISTSDLLSSIVSSCTTTLPRSGIQRAAVGALSAEVTDGLAER